jgi:hypothetical protein
LACVATARCDVHRTAPLCARACVCVATALLAPLVVTPPAAEVRAAVASWPQLSAMPQHARPSQLRRPEAGRSQLAATNVTSLAFSRRSAASKQSVRAQVRQMDDDDSNGFKRQFDETRGRGRHVNVATRTTRNHERSYPLAVAGQYSIDLPAVHHSCPSHYIQQLSGHSRLHFAPHG